MAPAQCIDWMLLLLGFHRLLRPYPLVVLAPIPCSVRALSIHLAVIFAVFPSFPASAKKKIGPGCIVKNCIRGGAQIISWWFLTPPSVVFGVVGWFFLVVVALVAHIPRANRMYQFGRSLLLELGGPQNSGVKVRGGKSGCG